jgi:hypothetical protein
MNLSFDEAPKMAWVLRVISVDFRDGSANMGFLFPNICYMGNE